MTEKHYPYCGGSFDRIIFDKDGSVWVPETENAKLRELVHCMAYCMQYERDCDECRMNGADGNIAEPCGCDGLLDRMRELGIEVDA